MCLHKNIRHAFTQIAEAAVETAASDWTSGESGGLSGTEVAAVAWPCCPISPSAGLHTVQRVGGGVLA